jgi:hypothetical protein
MVVVLLVIGWLLLHSHNAARKDSSLDKRSLDALASVEAAKEKRKLQRIFS